MFCKKYKRVDRHDDDFDHPSSLAPPLLGPLSGSPSPAGPSSSRRFAGQRGEARRGLLCCREEWNTAPREARARSGGAGMLLRLRGPPPWPRSPSRHGTPARHNDRPDRLTPSPLEAPLLHFGVAIVKISVPKCCGSCEEDKEFRRKMGYLLGSHVAVGQQKEATNQRKASRCRRKRIGARAADCR